MQSYGWTTLQLWLWRLWATKYFTGANRLRRRHGKTKLQWCMGLFCRYIHWHDWGLHTQNKSVKRKNSKYLTWEAMKYQHKKYHHWKRFTESEDYLDYARFVWTCNSVRSLTRTLSKAFEHDPVKKLKKNSEAFWSYANSRLKTRTKIFADDTKVNNCVKDYKGVEEPVRHRQHDRIRQQMAAAI